MTTCQACGGPLVPLGTLGNRRHYRCRNCGMDQSTTSQATRHYHVLGGLDGLYMPDTNDVFLTKREAQMFLHELAEDERDRIAMDKADAAPGEHVDKLVGSYRDGYYQVIRSDTQIDYLYEIGTCYEDECLQEQEDY